MNPVTSMSDRELKIEWRDLYIASWNAAFSMPPRTITPVYKERFKEISKEIKRRNPKGESTNGL